MPDWWGQPSTVPPPVEHYECFLLYAPQDVTPNTQTEG